MYTVVPLSFAIQFSIILALFQFRWITINAQGICGETKIENPRQKLSINYSRALLHYKNHLSQIQI